MNIEMSEFPCELQERRFLVGGFHENSEKLCVSISHIELYEDSKQAGLAQLEERGSHNPEVVSSSLTTRILFVSFPLLLFFLWNQPETWELSF